MQQLTRVASRILFAAAILLAGLAVSEKLANFLGLTVLRSYYTPARLLELSVVALIFVIALQLREIKRSLNSKGSQKEP
jgi:hypothetical protein